VGQKETLRPVARSLYEESLLESSWAQRYPYAQSAGRSRMDTRKIISAHKLIEYAFASPQKRVTIIENALQPPTFIMDTMYPDVERAAGHFLMSNCNKSSHLDRLDEIYQKREAHSDHHEQRLLNAMDAISHVKTMDWPLNDIWSVENTQGIPTDMEFCGITVRIKPCVIIKRRQSGFKYPFIGIVKTYFGKTNPLRIGENSERGVLFGTLLHWFTEENLSSLGTADTNMCIVADVFDERTYFAATRYKQRRKQLEALAQEIADRWDPISERLQKRDVNRSASVQK